MRKYQKEQSIGLIDTLLEANAEIKKLLEKSKLETAATLLADCQNCAIRLGTTIEQLEGEGTTAVSYLEEYCELLYQVSISVGDPASIKSNYNMLMKQTKKIRKSVNELKSDKIEIAFFPYKASMWDSLESVWLAANQDDRCECFVVPIPYYDRNSDGSFGTMHYEGNLFPSYVPITDWQHYDLAVVKPDIAYIHNPYDEFNFVTSVHPSYYSHEIKKHTGLLVYVPYYATSGDMSMGQSYLSAYLHADYIIMQSEWYRKFFDPAIPAKKLLPLGSPKFDRVIRMTHEKHVISVEWQSKMKGKTVYFFNTSISGLLQNTEAFLRKMAYVFNCFQGRKNALLLWRPHPLLESTLDSMRPQYKQIYMQLKNWFIESGLGIFDDTPDIDTSVALSDVYIGDSGSSVTSLFGMAGKPLFILDNNLNMEPEPDDLTTFVLREKMYMEGNIVWLYKLNLESGKVEPICQLADMTIRRYSDVVKIGSRFFIGPTHSQDICIVENGNLKKIALQDLNEKADSFVKTIRYKQYLYLIPGSYPSLVRYNTETEELAYYSDCVKEFSGAQDGVAFLQGVCIREHLLFIASAFDNRVLIFDMDSGNYRIQAVGQQVDGGCLSMEDDGTDFWMLPVNGSVITRWNPVTYEIHEYSQYPQDFICRNLLAGFTSKDRPFSSAVCFNDFVLFVPFWSNMFIRINKKTGEMSKWETPFLMLQSPKNCYYYYDRSFGATEKTSPTSFATFSYYNRTFYQIDIKTGECKQYQYQIDLDFRRDNEFGFNHVSKWLQYACFESDLNTLPNFLDGKLTGKPFDAERQFELYSKIAANGDGTCGEKVHGRIMEELFAKRR